MTDSLFHRNRLVEMAPLQHDAILFNPQSNRFCILNRTSAFIWDRLGDPVSADQLASEVSKHFAGVTREQALEDVNKALSMLVELDLVAPHHG